MHRIRLKQVLQSKAAFVGGEIFRRLGCHGKKWIVRRPSHVILNLRNQRRDEVESLVNIGKLIQQLDHAVVVFEGVQADPRQTVLTRYQIFVVGLMLVPENNDAQSGH